MAINESGQFDDVENSTYLSTSLSITTSQSELKVGVSKLVARQSLLVYNNGNQTIYIGPSGVTSSTGIPLTKNGFLTLPLGDSVSVYAVTSSGSATVVVQEIA
jgi:hypothetical protein